MPPQSGQPNMQAIQQALARRQGGPGMGQSPGTPVLNQQTPGAPGGGAPPTAQNPASPQPQFHSPFAGPSQASQGLDEQTKGQVKSLLAKLVTVL